MYGVKCSLHRSPGPERLVEPAPQLGRLGLRARVEHPHEYTLERLRLHQLVLELEAARVVAVGRTLPTRRRRGTGTTASASTRPTSRPLGRAFARAPTSSAASRRGRSGWAPSSTRSSPPDSRGRRSDTRARTTQSRGAATRPGANERVVLIDEPLLPVSGVFGPATGSECPQ